MLEICENFVSIQGESTHAGRLCAFIRLNGCNLDCVWCDTAYARSPKGDKIAVDELLTWVGTQNIKLVCITGGEPLLQEDTPRLAAELAEAGYEVLVETNGSRDISALPPPVMRIMDLKAPGSGMSESMDWDNIKHLRDSDEVKIIISDRDDYGWACKILAKYNLPEICPILFSAVQPGLKPEVLAGWIIEDRLPVRLQVQLHKILWPQIERGR